MTKQNYFFQCLNKKHTVLFAIVTLKSKIVSKTQSIAGLTYVNGTYKRTTKQSNSLSLWRSSPIFPPYLWNVHNATKKNTGRINNISEGFNNKFKTLVRTQHPKLI
ncbi:Uncharacterized protein FWK35_00003271 [Aphis craccivora]|uniref:Uncharacterized protein n=1 Tax=Aphis craccivora TaxID=307492 RepID=A0A6G0ZKG3_APHCR|nr:Uncharacterized protein FWK35_00003271 [Aphis craccivora]